MKRYKKLAALLFLFIILFTFLVSPLSVFSLQEHKCSSGSAGSCYQVNGEPTCVYVEDVKDCNR